MIKLRRLLLAGVVTIAITYVAILALAWVFQGKLIYPAPQQVEPIPAGYEEVALETSDGLALRMAFRAPESDQPVVVFFHGNGDNLPGAASAMGTLADAGFGVMLVEYRGYGGNPGEPSEDAFYRDGRTALGWLKGKGHEDIVLAGNSIGSGTAVQMATEIDPSGLILISPFTSVADVAAPMAELLPVRLMLRDQFANAEKIGDVAAPILIQHGTNDTLIPLAHSQALAEAAESPRLEEFEGAGHELAYLPEPQAAQVDWLANLPE